MDIRISKESEVSLRLQIGRQIAFLIATGKLKPGEALPSVRGLAGRLNIHHNTVSQAYQDLVGTQMLERRRGSRMVVSSPEQPQAPARLQDLDDLINATIRTAQQRGYTLQQLRQRVRERMLLHPPDHFLVVEQEPGLRQLLREEIKENLGLPVDACSRSELSANQGLAIGALVVSPPGTVRETTPLVPKDRPPIQITYNTAGLHVELVRQLRAPSVIAVVSVSEPFLQTARGLLAAAVGRQHTMREFFLPLEKSINLDAADVVFCDTIARRQVKAPKTVPCRLISSASLEHLASAIGR